MAYITQIGEKWRAQIAKGGIRKSKVFKTLEDANTWSKAMEDKVDKSKSIRNVLAAMGDIGTMLSTYIPDRVLDASADLPYATKQILEAAIPCKTLVGVYFLVYEEKVVYVGKSIDVLRRISRHRDNDIRFDSYAVINCEPDDLDGIESRYINALLPKYNTSAPRGR